MFTFTVVLVALIAAVLILVILLQSGQGGGLSGIAQGGPARQVLGTRQAPDTLEKATWTLGTIFITICVVMNFFVGTEEQQRSVIQERAQQQGQTQQPAQTPGGGQDAAPLPGGSGDQSGQGSGGQQSGGASGGN
jgi:preprotein translocase subunit SecG